MIRRTRLTALLIVAFPIASFALLRSGMLPAGWFGVPDLMLAAGLLARNAVARGLTVPGWVRREWER